MNHSTHSPYRRAALMAALTAVVTVIALPAAAHDFKAGDVVIDHPYTVPSVPGSANGAVYFRALRNDGRVADRLIGASSPAARRVEIHEMQMEGDVMRMRELAALELPPGESVAVRQGQRYHLMLLDLTKLLVDGDRFDVTLTFERGGERTVKAWVLADKRRKAAGGTDKEGGHQAHHSH